MQVFFLQHFFQESGIWDGFRCDFGSFVVFFFRVIQGVRILPACCGHHFASRLCSTNLDNLWEAAVYLVLMASNHQKTPRNATGNYDVEVGRIRQSIVFGDNGIEFFLSGASVPRKG